MALRKHLKYVARYTARPLKKLKLFVKQNLGWLHDPIIQPYRGFGNLHHIWIKGRVLEDNGLAKTAEKGSLWNNVLAMAKRYISDELPGVHVKITFQDQEVVAVTDEHGIFNVEMDVPRMWDKSQVWHRVTFELLDEVKPDQPKVTATGEIMLYPQESRFGIISDVDDTILISHSTKMMKKLRLMLTKNAGARLPFKGVAAFYRALHRPASSGYNPLFFVSSSEWNLYDLLIDFCDAHDIPKGVFMLKKLKSNIGELFRSGTGSHLHKKEKIKVLMQAFPNLPFILIGDSGQHDAEIYQAIAEEFPDKILAIYIRDVRRSRHSAVTRIAAEVSGKGVTMKLVKDTREAAIHAIRNGFVSPEDLPHIEVEVQKDEEPPRSLVEEVVAKNEE